MSDLAGQDARTASHVINGYLAQNKQHLTSKMHAEIQGVADRLAEYGYSKSD